MDRRENLQLFIKIIASFLIWGSLTAVWSWVWMDNYADDIMRPFGYKGNWLVFAVYGLLLFFFTHFYGAYQIGHNRKWDMAFSSVLALVITNVITYFQASLIGRMLLSVPPFFIMSAIQVFLALIWAWLTGSIFQRCFPPCPMLLVHGDEDSSKALIKKFLSRSDLFAVQATIDISQGLEAVREQIVKYPAIILCQVPARERNSIIKFCFGQSIRVYITPMLSDILVRGAVNISIFDTPLLLCHNQKPNIVNRAAKRLMDICLASLGLLISLPVMIIAAALIKISDGGPVFFCQDRCTADNKIFKICKFRSMIVDAEKDGRPRPAEERDARITGIGRIIRKLRIDELPQWFNIIKGDMSLVGPRPERIEHVDKYGNEIPEFHFRSKVKAGLTGYAQVKGRYNTTVYDKLKMDLMYITNGSNVEDLKLLLMTVKILFMKNSTEGFAENSQKKNGPENFED